MSLPLLCLIYLALPLVLTDRVVVTNTGPVQGITVSFDEVQIEAFLGIPYAEPPTGRLRFRRPVPKTPWKGVYDASVLPPSCMQNITHLYYEPQSSDMTEDCLFLNMWVPYSKEEGELKTIIMFIHGGAFQLGSTNMDIYNGENLAQFGDVVVVNMNYRLGAFGFFFADQENADGNMGIYDQITALKWIRDNAKEFGGDPHKIVLMGESAGSMIVGGHVVSPMTRHLIQRVIMQSGSPTFPLILDSNERLLNRSQKLASLAGCADQKITLRNSARAVVECLKRMPAEKLTQAEGFMKQMNPITFYPRTGDEYLTVPVIQSLRNGDFKDSEMLIGNNDEEGPFFLTAAAPDYFGHYGVNRVETVSKRFASQVVTVIFKNTEQKNPKDIANYYINAVQNATSGNLVTAISRSMGDYLINCDSYFHAEFHSLKAPVYYYVFTRRPSTTVLADWIPATHFDELQYVFKNPLFGNFTPQEQEFSDKMMSRWIAFAKTGNPNIEGSLHWPHFTVKDPVYLRIDEEESVHLRPDNYRCEFWRERFQAVLDDAIAAKIRGMSSSATFSTYGLITIVMMLCFNLKVL